MYLQSYDDDAIFHLKFVSKIYIYVQIHFTVVEYYALRTLKIYYHTYGLRIYIYFPSTHKMFTIHKNEYTFAVKIRTLSHQR